MRSILLVALAGLVLLSSPAVAQEKSSRFGVALDTKTYPQGTPKEALKSVIDAAAAKKFDYLVAQLADPAFIDDHIKRVHGGKFQAQVDDTRTRLDAAHQKLLKRFLDEGRWSINGTEATVRLDDLKDRAVYLVKKTGRWYLEHRSSP